MKPNTNARDRAFAEVCRHLLATQRKSRKRIAFTELLDKALHTRPERHYVAYDCTLRRLYAMRNGSVSFSNELTAQKYVEINEQVSKVMARRPRLSVPMALAFALTFKRPGRFYIPDKRARAILRQVVADECMVI